MAMADALPSAHCADVALDAVSTPSKGKGVGRGCGRER